MKKNHTTTHTAAATSDHRGEGSYISYTLGFVLSVIATLIPFFMLYDHVLRGTSFVILALAAALLQLFVQLVLFLHLNFKKRSALNLLIFSYMLVLVITIVAGTLWIMHNLNQNMVQNVFPNNDYTPQAQAY